ncbi:MAG: SLC13 family permease [Gammaproteobacteria bacterium]
MSARGVAPFLRREWLFCLLLLLLPLLTVLAPGPIPATIRQLPALLETETLILLAGLLVLTRGIEASGYLVAAGRWLIARVRTERGLALLLVTFSAILSMVVTNDVALFIVVPLTLAMRGLATLPLGRLVIFEALAVNAGSALSPIGNPQNLYLWQRSGADFSAFIAAMAPMVLPLLAVLLVTTAAVFAARPVAIPATEPATASRPALLAAALGLYPLFIAMADTGVGAFALAGILLLFAWRWRDVMRGVDWLLLGVFTLMFLDLGLLADMPVLALPAQQAANSPTGTFLAGITLSQVVSNVPAAIFLSSITESGITESSIAGSTLAEPGIGALWPSLCPIALPGCSWVPLAWGVTAGGFGLAIGSLANLIALRLAGIQRLWVAFHVWSIGALAVATALGWLMLDAMAPG